MTKYRGSEGPPGAAQGAAQDERETLAVVQGRLGLGVGLFLAALLGLSLVAGVGLRDAIGLAFFYLLLPALGWAQLPLLSHTVIDRLPVYAGSAATLVFIGTVALVCGARPEGEGSVNAFPGLVGLPIGVLFSWVGGLVGLGLLAVLALEPLDRQVTDGSSDIVNQLLPRTPREKRAFAGLSVAAGVGEELAYRGYALAALEPFVSGPWSAAVVSTVPFALLHTYQGSVGTLRTGLIGFAFAGSVVVTGSLLPAIFAHTLFDLLAGFVVGPWLLAKRTSAEI